MKERAERRDTAVRREAVVTKDLLDPKVKQDQKDHQDPLEQWADEDLMDHKDLSVITAKTVSQVAQESEVCKV